jgi:hypothetical protein
MEVSGQLHELAALPSGKSPSYSSDRRVGEPQSRSGRGGEGSNSQSLLGIEPPVAQHYTTELSRLLLQL